MFIERSAGRIRLTRLIFVVAGLVPCLLLAAWAVHRGSAAHRDDVRGSWQRAVGLPIDVASCPCDAVRLRCAVSEGRLVLIVCAMSLSWVWEPWAAPRHASSRDDEIVQQPDQGHWVEYIRFFAAIRQAPKARCAGWTPEQAGASAPDAWEPRHYCLSSDNTDCGAAFACASIAVPACCMIWARVMAAVSCAKSASMIRLRAAD